MPHGNDSEYEPSNPYSTKFDITSADFKLFLVIWNQGQGMTTPQLHLNMAEWLEWNWQRGNTRLLLMAFRSAGKSTIVGLFAAWLLYTQADLRILVLGAEFSLAKKMVRNVKRILEKHPLTEHLLPENPDQWASDRFTIKRMTELRDPSMLAKGVTSNITGTRADIVICDDVEVPNTCDTAEKREALRERLGEINYVLVPNGTQLYVGTPHTYYSIYAEDVRTEIGEEQIFLDGFKRLKLPVLNDMGESAWVEKYGEQTIAQMKRAAGPNTFASQMMLQPVNIAQGRLNPQLLQHYDYALQYQKELQTLFLGQNKLASASAFWDPAFGSAKGDRSVLAIIYSDADGQFYLHHMEYIKVDARDEQDEATQQCRIIAQIAKSHYLPSITVETNGIGKFLPKILRNEMAKSHAPCTVLEQNQTRSKSDRILEAFDAILAAKRLSVHTNVLKTPFRNEMQEWRPSGSKGHDDGLDAVASALLQSPDRLPRIFGKGHHGWMNNNRTIRADTNFRV